MNAWSGAPVPVQICCRVARRWSGRAPTSCRRSNAAIAMQLGGRGGERGPALDDVATRLTEDQLIRQVLLGGGNMPAYGSALSPAETTALVRFLETLHPSYQPASKGCVAAGGSDRAACRAIRRWNAAEVRRRRADLACGESLKQCA